MRSFFDTEFFEDGKIIELISIGIVRHDGPELLLYNRDADIERASREPWLRDNVVPKLPPRTDARWLSYKDLATRVRDFLVPLNPQEPTDMWAYVGASDWVAFYQLFGRLIDLPEGLPKWFHELKQLMKSAGLKKADLPPVPQGAHDALVDARWNRDVYDFIAARLGVRP